METKSIHFFFKKKLTKKNCDLKYGAGDKKLSNILK